MSGRLLTFELQMRSSYHIGAGHGGHGGLVDSMLLRDASGRPTIRGSTFGQLLMNAARDMLTWPPLEQHQYQRCQASGEDQSLAYCSPDTSCPICHIFGSPHHKRRWHVRSSRPPERLMPHKHGTAVTRVSVSPRTRRAAKHQLFSEELGDGRLRFLFDVQWTGMGEPAEAEVAFLAAAARNLRHLGRARRRGRGECSARLIAVDGHPPAHDWLEAFDRHWMTTAWAPPMAQTIVPPPATAIEHADGEASDDAVRLRLVARLMEPVLIAIQPEAGNTIRGASTIPGTSIVGALVARASTEGGPAAAAEAAALLRRSGIVVQSLLPTDRAGNQLYASQVIPRDILRCERHPSTDPWSRHPDRSALATPVSAWRCPDCEASGHDGKMGPAEGHWTVIDNDRLADTAVHHRHEMHLRVNRRTNRARDGDLFGYVALEEGQHFLGEIISPTESPWTRLSQLLGLGADDDCLDLTIGKAGGRGYGHVRLAIERLDADLAAHGGGGPLEGRPKKAPWTDQFVMLLASDCIVQDRWGRYPRGFADEWLADALGIEGVRLATNSAEAGSDPSAVSFASTRVVDGFYGHTGLPRWRDLALTAGSIALIDASASTLDESTLLTRLRRLERSGIGLRRHEGYGQVRFNPPEHGIIWAPESDESVRPHGLPIPASLMDPRPPISPLREEAATLRDWAGRVAELVDAHRPSLGSDDVEVLMRVLRASSGQGDIDHVKDRLDALGTRIVLQALPGTLAVEPPKGTPIDRPAKRGLFGEQGSPLIDDIRALLNQIAKDTGDESLRAHGVRMLADALGDALSVGRAGGTTR